MSINEVIIANEEEIKKFPYKKKDFINLGIKDGSFKKLMMNLLKVEKNEELTKTGHCKLLYTQEEHNRPTYFFDEYAYNLAIEHIKNKEKSNNSVELGLIKTNEELKNQLTTAALKIKDMELKNKDAQNTIKLLEKEYKYLEETKTHINDMYNAIAQEKQHNIDVIDHLTFKQRLKFLFTGKINYNTKINWRKDEIKTEYK